MTRIAGDAPSETQHLGHFATENTGSNLSTSLPRKNGCCGCGCFSGCLVMILLLLGLVAAVYFFGFKNDRYMVYFDRVAVWTYQSAIRPKLVETYTANMSTPERARFLALSDRAVQKYLALPPEEKKAILSEAATALWYLQQQAILPPEKIPHLKKFVETLQSDSSI